MGYETPDDFAGGRAVKTWDIYGNLLYEAKSEFDQCVEKTQSEILGALEVSGLIEAPEEEARKEAAYNIGGIIRRNFAAAERSINGTSNQR